MVLFLCECDNWQLKPANKNSLTMCHLSEKGKPVQKQLDIFSLKSTEQKLLRSRKQASGGKIKRRGYICERECGRTNEKMCCDGWNECKKVTHLKLSNFSGTKTILTLKKTSSHLYSVVTFLLFQNIRFYFEK